MKVIRVIFKAIGGFCRWLIKAVFRFMWAASRVVDCRHCNRNVPKI